jgi:hypothetical protein
MMSEYDQPEVPATEFGAWVRQQRDAHLQASAKAMNDMLSGGGQDAHRATSAQLRAGQHGIFGAADSPQEQAAAVAARQAEVGSAYGGRPLERQGGTFNPADYLCGPVPPQRDLRFANQPSGPPTGESGLARFMRERQQ